MPVKRLPFAARLPLEVHRLGGAVRILFYPLDIIYFTVFSKKRERAKQPEIYRFY